MKRALRNTETAMFVKSDGGATESIQTARCFLNFDEAVAFCRANKLAAVELVTRTDDQAEYVTSMPARYLAPAKEDKDENEADVSAVASEREDHGVPTQEYAVDVEAKRAECDLDESEIAISQHANVELAAQAPQFHYSPPAKCEVCGAELHGRWFFVDGRLNESGEWRDMCSKCFFIKGVKIRVGKGQLYQRQADGRWLLVGGFGR